MALIALRPTPDHAAEHDDGVPVEGIVRGNRSGVYEIDIDTDIRLAMTGPLAKAA